ncbi:MAG: DUF4390 domain-containing protein [Parasulfuritortus sp.]|nr:DUF4390 domain-containing protein [Parasulfuritortus sp.]
MPPLSRRDFLRLTCAAALALSAVGARAEDLLRLHDVELQLRGENYVLVGEYAVELTATLEDALQKGISFTFIQAFECERPRDYWFAEGITVTHRIRQLSYNALLRQYQLQTGSLHESFDSLNEALRALGSLDDWPVLERKQINRKYLYQARVRMYLDATKLPKPLQLNAIASERWDMDSGWREWSFKP